MIVEDQSRLIEFLSDPATHRGAPVERLQTHISEVFLAGDRAYKLKRAVRLPYVDFSSVALRLAACEKEVALNSLTAPGLYVGVRRITRAADGRLAFDGDGPTVDAVVEMVRFDQDCLLDRMAVDGRLTPSLMDRLAAAIARFHRQAPVVADAGGFETMANVLAINAAGFSTSHVFPPAEISASAQAFEERLRSLRARLDARAAAGRVRRCHGDLHLRNICLVDGEPRLFDCIEFSDCIATTDVLYDLAFLLMDLWHRDLAAFANQVANRYLDEMDDEDGFALLPFFMAVRAAVRAHVTATQAEEDGRDRGALAGQARSYFRLAGALLEPGRPLVVAVGGLSGSGKSTVAEALAPLVGAAPGARILESDRIRKAMFDRPPDERLGAEAYTADVSQRVYGELAQRSARLAADGATVVAHAVFAGPGQRRAIEEAARRAAVPFLGIWLETDASTLRQRIAGRRGGPSDATVEVLERQLCRDIGEVGWRRVDAGRTVDRVVRDIAGIIRP